MPLIRQRIVNTRQPAAARLVDWSNPITSGLVAAIYPIGDGLMWDSVTNELLTSVGVPTSGNNRQGRAFVTNGSSQYAWRQINNFPTGANATLLTITFDDGAGNDSRLLALASSSSNNPIISITRSTTPGLLLGFIRTDAGSGFTGSATIQTTLINNNAPHVIALAVGNNGGTGSLDWYVDGRSENSYSGTLGTTTVNRLAVGALLRAAAGSYYKGPTDGALIWNRKLSAAEGISVTSNPWQVFSP